MVQNKIAAPITNIITACSKKQYDVIVVGSGAGGLTAALISAEAGLKVAVLEATSFIGGSTAWSSGGLWIPGNDFARSFGINDDSERVKTYLRACLGSRYDEEKVDAFLESGPAAVRHMTQTKSVIFSGVPLPDYFQHRPGASVGRTIKTDPMDGELLGPWLDKIRRPLPAFSLFETMMVDLVDLAKFEGALKSVSSATFVTKRLASFAWQRMRHGRGTYLAAGNALIGQLLLACLKASVDVLTDTRAMQLVMDDDRVVGVEARCLHGSVRLSATRGVVLAGGGYGGDEQRVKGVLKDPYHLPVQPEGNLGDGIRMGIEAGGVLETDNFSAATFVPVSVEPGHNGRRFPDFGSTRGKPGFITVDRNGRRFINEVTPYHTFGQEMMKRSLHTSFVIGDATAVQRFGFGLAKQAPFPLAPFIASGYITRADSLAELAEKLGIDAAGLAKTVAQFNNYADTGVDEDFGRGSSVYDKFYGDPERKPNSNLAPLTKPPFYGLVMHVGSQGTAEGLRTGVNGEVLTAEAKAVPGLYAVGMDQNSVLRGEYVGGGSGIGPAVTFGYRAARHIAGNRAQQRVDARDRAESLTV